MSAAIDVREAFVIYPSRGGGTAALQGLTLVVEAGEIVVLLGPSGSGKSTLLRAVAGFEALSAGSVHVLGTDVSGLEGRAADSYRARELGLLDQHYARSLSPDLRCGQTVALQLELLGHDAVTSARTAQGLLERVGLGDRSGDRPGVLSGGEQQRVAVCAAVAHRPGLLLADEPAGELDAANGELVYQLLAEIVRERGATALIVSHDTAAASIADRIVHVRDGRVVAESAPGERPALVVGRGGWVRLPEPQLVTLGSPALLAPSRSGPGLLLTPVGAVSPDAAERGSPERRTGEPLELVAELAGVAKRYGANGDGRVVFTGIDLPVRAGRFTALVGRSGSGKTTLLHLLAGLERPTTGDVTLLGVDFGALTRDELAEHRRRHVALVTQEPGLVPYLSALENVELGLHLRSAPGDRGQQARTALVDVGLEERLHSAAARLSAGERQRVAIARALAAHVRVLLVDEPTARLDEENAHEVARLLVRAAHERGLAVVCATHDPVLVELADDVVDLATRGARAA